MHNAYAFAVPSNMKSTVRRLVTHMRQRGLLQAEAAAALGVSQGHLSKVMAGRVPASARLQVTIDKLIATQSAKPAPASELTILIGTALTESVEFRTIVQAALTLVNKSKRQ